MKINKYPKVKRKTVSASIITTVIGLLVSIYAPQVKAQTDGAHDRVGQTAISVGGVASPERLDAIKAMGAKVVRFDLAWSTVMAGGPNSYNWTEMDAEILGIVSRGMEPLAILLTTPEWARLAGSTSNMCPPVNMNDCANFLRVAALRYPQIHYWEIWNEPNIIEFWQPKPDAVKYTALLKAAYKAIKAVNPLAVVLTAGTAPAGSNGTNISPIDFLKQIYNNGGGGSFDGVSHHPYCFDAAGCPNFYASWSAWSQMNDTNPSLRSLMVSHGDGAKKIWVTEFGSPTGGGAKSVTEAQQAQMVTDVYKLFRSYSWAGSFFAWFKDRDMCVTSDVLLGNLECYFGLIRYDGTNKPGYNAFVAAGAYATPLPDVIVTSLTYANGIYTGVVKNQGDVATPAGIDVGIGYLVDGVKQTWGQVSGPLEAGASVTIGTDGGGFTVPDGNHVISAFVNDSNRFEESFVSNNGISKKITIGDLPDLIVTSVTYKDGVFKSIVKNQGSAATPAGKDISIGYLVDRVSRTWGKVTGSLAPGASDTINTDGGNYLIPDGYHTITAYVNDSNSIAESVETNNQLSKIITLGPLPDVIVTSLSYNKGNFTCVVKNQGLMETPPGVTLGVGYLVDGVNKTWGYVNDPLAAGASVTIGTNGGSFTIPNGTHTIGAYIDDINRFAESDENNNQLALPITVGSVGVTNTRSSISQISVYPNPAGDVLTIELTGIAGKQQVQIFNEIGTLVKELELTGTMEANISDLQNGLYFIHLKNSSLHVQKFIKR
jgi:hypothetical protein